jgi:hypothetical protein
LAEYEEPAPVLVPGRPLEPAEAARLQRSAGNLAVYRLISGSRDGANVEAPDRRAMTLVPSPRRAAATVRGDEPPIQSNLSEELAGQAAGSRAVVRGLRERRGAPLTIGPTLHRQAPSAPAAPGTGTATGPIEFRGQSLSDDPGQLRTMLLKLIETSGQGEAETFAYAFLRMDWTEKARLQLAGVEPQHLTAVQNAFEAVLKVVQDEQKHYLESFGPLIVEDTKTVLNKSKELLQQEQLKYTDTPPVQPDLDGLRAAAHELAAKRKAADAAAKAAQAAHRAMIDQNQPKADQGSPFPQPIVPFFPDPKLRDAAHEANDAWWNLEHEYGDLRAKHEAKFPALAMYSANEDGGAAERLDDLPTWGLWADSRMKSKIVMECDERINNVDTALKGLNEDKAWQLPKMIDASLKGRGAAPHEARWVHDEAIKRAVKAAEAQQLIMAVGIAVMVVTAVATGGAALAAEGTVAAAVLGSVAAVGEGLSAGMSIATAYSDLRDFQFDKAASKSDLDAAHSISQDDPSFFWVALDLVQAGLSVVAAGAAFATATKAIKSIRSGEAVLENLMMIEGSGGGAGPKIIAKTVDEAQASGALQRAIVGEGKQFREAELSRIKDLVEQGLGRQWETEFAELQSRGRVLPLTKEAFERAGVVKSEIEELVKKRAFEPDGPMGGYYHWDTRTCFIKPGAEGDVSYRVVHEMSHAIQINRNEYAGFYREFEAFAAQRKMMLRIQELYPAWQPAENDAWLLTANDQKVAEFIRDNYHHDIPPSVLADPLSPKALDNAFGVLAKVIQSWQTVK